MLNHQSLRNVNRSSWIGLTTFILIMAAVVGFIRTPTPSDIRLRAVGSDRVLLAADGQVLQTLRTDFNKRRLSWETLEQFSEEIQIAVVESEDQRFWSHFGIDFLGLVRAVRANIAGRPVQGASTLTMQLSDLIQDDVLLRHQAIRKGSFFHKFPQIVRAIFLELRWSKKEILEGYLNLIHLKGEFQGVPAVSQAYLKKAPVALSREEAVLIAAMISSPNQKRTSLEARACQLLNRIAARKGESSSTCETVKTLAASFFGSPPAMPEDLAVAPHLARRLFQEHPTESLVTSTLDARLQREVTAILEKNIARLREENVRDSSAIVIDNQTGNVLAYVGTVSTSENPHVDGVTSYRQAGSSLKPFLYGKAIDSRKMTAASILLDEPTAISWGGDVYRPTNYDKHFYGPVSVREALGSSLNVPAVKTVTIIGLHEAYHVLQMIHLSQLKEPDFYGVSLALGAVEVRLDELANAYRIYANQGTWSPLRFTRSDRSKQTEKVYSPEASYVLANILSDPNARAIGFGWESPLETPFFTAVKTGTSKDYRDNWCVGFSQKYTVAVWAGNFDAQAMRKVSGVSGVGPSWYEIMLKLHEHEASLPQARPPGLVAKMVRHQWNSHEYEEVFLKGTEPVGTVIEPALEKKPQFVFPAEGSVLVRDPHADQGHIALFVRFKGTVPETSHLLLDNREVGIAKSPFKLESFSSGSHVLELRAPERTSLTRVNFTVKGANESSDK